MSIFKRRKKETLKKINIDYGKYICPKCGQEITEITQALTDSKTNEPMHFDCARKTILEKEKLPENSNLIYLGNGTFGIVEFLTTNPRETQKFKIIKTINFETSETDTNWRGELKEIFDNTCNTSNKKNV